jgi:hypothetical protein
MPGINALRTRPGLVLDSTIVNGPAEKLSGEWENVRENVRWLKGRGGRGHVVPMSWSSTGSCTTLPLSMLVMLACPLLEPCGMLWGLPSTVPASRGEAQQWIRLGEASHTMPVSKAQYLLL